MFFWTIISEDGFVDLGFNNANKYMQLNNEDKTNDKN